MTCLVIWIMRNTHSNVIASKELKLEEIEDYLRWVIHAIFSQRNVKERKVKSLHKSIKFVIMCYFFECVKWWNLIGWNETNHLRLKTMKIEKVLTNTWSAFYFVWNLSKIICGLLHRFWKEFLFLERPFCWKVPINIT